MKLKVAKADDFSNDCEAFLTSLVTSFKTQVGEVTILQTKVATLSVGATPPAAPLVASTFSSLSQCLGLGASPQVTYTQQVPLSSNQVNQLPNESPPALLATVAALEQKFNDLTKQFTKLGTQQTTATVKFGSACFASPQEVLPVIQAEMKTSYFGCFVNADVLLEWILGNSSKDTLIGLGSICVLCHVLRLVYQRESGVLCIVHLFGRYAVEFELPIGVLCLAGSLLALCWPHGKGQTS
jgi:hypothetical protein